jgi:hypothetical protein
MNHFYALAAACAIALSGVVHPAFPAADTTAGHVPLIAVNNLEGRGVTPDEAATLSDVLRTELLNTGRYKVMERTQMEAILKEQGFQQSGACSDQQCMVEMGQLLGAELLVAGSIGKVGKAYSINVRIISIRTSEIVKNVSHNYSGAIEELLTSEIKKVAIKLATPDKDAPAPAAAAPASGSTPGKKKSSMGTILIVSGVSLAVVGGGIAAFVLLNNNTSSTPAATDYATVDLTW